jgi:hypothetical protein
MRVQTKISVWLLFVIPDPHSDESAHGRATVGALPKTNSSIIRGLKNFNYVVVEAMSTTDSMACVVSCSMLALLLFLDDVIGPRWTRRKSVSQFG